MFSNLRNKQIKQLEATSSILIKYILEKHESEVSQSIDAVVSFLAGMMPISKSLSPHYLNLTKTQIF